MARVKTWFTAASAVAVALAAILFFLYPRASRPRHVILVSVDTLRADHLSCYGYTKHRTPNIDRIAAEGVLFENAATATPLTLPAHSTLLSGRTPLRHGVIDNFGFRLDDKEETLAEVMRASGFATGGFVGAFVLDSRWGLGQGFDTYFDDFDAPEEAATALEASQRTGDKVLARALEWIRGQAGKPFFAFIHFYDPHTPYAPPEPFRKEFGPTELGYYDGEVAFVDSLVGQLQKALGDEGIYDDTLLVLLADHGESLGDHGEATHGYFIYDATVRIPLLIKAPGVAVGARVRAQVRTIDVMPTLLDLAGVKVPSAVEGVSLRSLLRDPRANPGLQAYIESRYPELHFGWAPLRGLRTERYKLIDAPERELYDLREDPAEGKNLFSERRGVSDQLLAAMERLARERPALGLAAAATDRETEERLRALGYLTAAADRPSSAPGQALADPKAKIGIFNKVAEARVSGQIGEVDHAITLLEEVLHEDPDVMLGYMLLGNIRLAHRDFRKAEAIFRRALSRNDRSLDAAYGLALAFKGQGRLDDAAVGFERCRTGADPRRGRATYQLADVRMAQGKPGEAERLLRDELKGSPDAALGLSLADALLAQGKKEEALSALRAAARNSTENALVQLSMGNVLLDGGDVSGAIAAYERAAKLAPKDAKVWNAGGNALARRGDARGALEAFQKAVGLDASFAPAQNNLGIALAQLGRPEDAEKAFRNAIASDATYAQAFNNLGFLYLRAGAAREAVPLFRRALALKPDYEQARANLMAAQRVVSGAR